jgi:hypothetical protein
MVPAFPGRQAAPRGSPPGPGKLIDQRDVNFLLIKLTYDEEQELSTLACIMEFLKRGGSPNEPGVVPAGN